MSQLTLALAVLTRPRLIDGAILLPTRIQLRVLNSTRHKYPDAFLIRRFYTGGKIPRAYYAIAYA